MRNILTFPRHNHRHASAAAKAFVKPALPQLGGRTRMENQHHTQH